MATFSVVISRVKNSVPDLSNLDCSFDNFRDAFGYFGELCDRYDVDYEFKGETTTTAGGAGYDYSIRLNVEGVEEPQFQDYCLCGC